MPYTDWRQQEFDFGFHSFYHSPWRAYMDTWDARRWLEVLGAVFNVSPQEADATAQLLAEAGIRTARVELNWGNFSYDDPSKLEQLRRQSFDMTLQALRRHGIRPIILLNANSGNPSPSKIWKARLVKPAPKGAVQIELDRTEDIVPGYTGLRGMAYQAMYPVITSCTSQSGPGVCQLSAPLPKDVPAGELELIKLRYQPLGGTVFEDGRPNPAAKETLDGWMLYVKSVAAYVKQQMGGTSTDAGFDLEVWNELSFGSHYLDISYYYSPPLKFSEQPSYTQGPLSIKGFEVLLPMTAKYVSDPKNGLAGVRVISGFSNQRPWDNGVEQWEGQAGFSRHYYTGYNEFNSLISPALYAKRDDPTMNALGEIDGTLKPGSANKIIPGTNYVPAHVAAYPEYWFGGYKTEHVVRDLQPFPNPFANHFRYASPGGGKQAEVWMTEGNFDRNSFGQRVRRESGALATDPAYISLMHRLGAKTTLRSFAFFGHKGVKTYTIHALKGGDASLALLPEAYFSALAAAGYVLTDEVREHAGLQLKVIRHVSSMMKDSVPIDTPRPLQVTDVIEHHPLRVFQGDGTPEHPDLFMASDLAVLPYQLSDSRFAVGYYMVTRDVTQAWNTEKAVLDPARYDLPPQTLTITLSNMRGNGVTVESYDPLTNDTWPVTVAAAGENSLTLTVDATDYPRFLLITEAQEGPVIASPVLARNSDGTGSLTFASNVDGVARLTWGSYPYRRVGTFKEEFFQEVTFQKKNYEKRVSILNYNKELSGKSGSYRWSGTIIPRFTETYTFRVISNGCYHDLKINGQTIIQPCTGLMMGSVELQANKPYQLVHEYWTRYNSMHTVMLYWGSGSQPKEIVTPASAPPKTIKVKKGETVRITIPDLLAGEGVKLTLEADGLTTEFPRWNYDVKGVLWQ